MFICDIRDEGDYCFDCPRSHPDEQCEYWVEVKYVRHGHWIHHDELICCENECSECHEYMHICSARYGCEGRKQFSYCPNCGAKMDGGVSCE